MDHSNAGFLNKRGDFSNEEIFKTRVQRFGALALAVACQNAPAESASPWKLNLHLPYALQYDFMLCATTYNVSVSLKQVREPQRELMVYGK